MFHTLNSIAGSKQDYKVCKSCGCVNWYENKSCHNCNTNIFKKMTQSWIEYELKYLVESGNYNTEEEAYDVGYDV